MKTRDTYTGIADPTRRAILDLLRIRDVASAGEIGSAFSEISQPAISRHLRILRECELVRVVKHGKTQNYAVDPTGLNAIREGWLAGFAGMPTRSLAKLREIVEND